MLLSFFMYTFLSIFFFRIRKDILSSEFVPDSNLTETIFISILAAKMNENLTKF